MLNGRKTEHINPLFSSRDDKRVKCYLKNCFTNCKSLFEYFGIRSATFDYILKEIEKIIKKFSTSVICTFIKDTWIFIVVHGEHKNTCRSYEKSNLNAKIVLTIFCVFWHAGRSQYKHTHKKTVVSLFRRTRQNEISSEFAPIATIDAFSSH